MFFINQKSQIHKYDLKKSTYIIIHKHGRLAANAGFIRRKNMSNLMPNGREKNGYVMSQSQVDDLEKKKVEALERIANALEKLTNPKSGASNSLFDLFLGK